MSQSRKMSMVEAVTNTVVGYLLAVGTQLIAFPVFGLEASLPEHLGIGMIFVVVSLVRSYLLRRAFSGAWRRPVAGKRTRWHDPPALASHGRSRPHVRGRLMGRGHQPDPLTRRQVEAMAGYGVPETDISGLIGIDPKTLRKHYWAELDYGHTKANIKVAENLYRMATAGDGRESLTAAIFWLKARTGWREKQLHEIHAPAPLITRIERVIIDPKNNTITPDPYFSRDADAA